MNSRTGQIDAPAIPDFAVVGYLGSGGFADVFQYRHRTGTTYAVKVWRNQLEGDARAKFLAEAEALGRLGALGSHPNIVSMVPPSILNGRPYLVMELCLGGSLAGKGPMPLVADVLRIGIQMAGALETSHLHDLLHCDVKPGNILLARDGTAKLSDFGIAEPATSRGPGAEMLTPQYSAPEVDADGETSALSDVYALAATMYELLTGTPPFRVAGGDNSQPAIERRKRLDQVPPIGRPDVGPELERALRGALLCDVAERGKAFGGSHGRGPAAMFGTALREIAAVRRDEQTTMVIYSPADNPDAHAEPVEFAPPVYEPEASANPTGQRPKLVSQPGSDPGEHPGPDTLSATRRTSREKAETLTDTTARPVQVSLNIAADGTTERAAVTPDRKPMRIALVVFAAAVLAAAVTGLVISNKPGPDRRPGAAPTTLAPTDPNAGLIVPVPQVTGHRLASGSVTFTWTYQPVDAGDRYSLTRTDTVRLVPVPVGKRTWTLKNAPANVCVEVIVIRSNGNASPSSGRACVK